MMKLSIFFWYQSLTSRYQINTSLVCIRITLECLFHHNIVFHTVLLLTKDLTSQPEKYEFMESTCLTMFPTILMQLTWQKDTGPFEDTVTAPNSWLATAIGLRAGSPWGRQYVLWIGIQYMVQFLPEPGPTGPEIRGWKQEYYHSLSLLVTHQENFSFLSHQGEVWASSSMACLQWLLAGALSPLEPKLLGMTCKNVTGVDSLVVNSTK